MNKICTSMEQSQKLAEILPIESADMFYRNNGIDVKLMWEHNAQQVTNPCWSLSALLDILPEYIGDYGKCLYYDMGHYYCGYMVDGDFMLTIEETMADNPVDACVEMIIKLKELKLL